MTYKDWKWNTHIRPLRGTYEKGLVLVDCHLSESWPAVILKAKNLILVCYLHSANEQQPPVNCNKVITTEYKTVLCNMWSRLNTYWSNHQNKILNFCNNLPNLALCINNEYIRCRVRQHVDEGWNQLRFFWESYSSVPHTAQWFSPVTCIWVWVGVWCIHMPVGWAHLCLPLSCQLLVPYIDWNTLT